MMDLQTYLRFVKLVRSVPVIHRTTWKMRKTYHAVWRKLLVRRPVVDAGPLLLGAIAGAKPYAAGKMGSTEAAAVAAFFRRESSGAKGRMLPPYPPYIFHTLFVNSGVFPQTEECFDRFCESYLGTVSQCDMLVAWDVAGETRVFRNYCPKTTLVRLRSLDPYFSAAPWTRALAGKRVLAVSPFVDSIEKQYAKREQIWDNPDILPAFELLTLRAPFSAGLVPPKAADWFEAVRAMTAQMDRMQYDVALIGAGAFSLPLAVHAKSRGKVGIHLGGNLQFLFGITGRRWKAIDEFKGLVKDSWCTPSDAETPQAFGTNEGGCYW